jgi:hypothetical protein
MPYTIVFRASTTRDVSAANVTTARHALAIVGSLQGGSDDVKYITSPQEGEIGIEMLRLLAKEEQEELPALT